MAKEGSSNVAIVVIFMVVVLAIAAFVVYQGGYLSSEPSTNTNVEVKLPTTTSVDVAPKNP